MIVEDKFKKLQEKIDNLEEIINQQNNKLDLILKILNEDIKENCEKMSNHINFIETVYDKVKSPMYYICNKFNNMRMIAMD